MVKHIWKSCKSLLAIHRTEVRDIPVNFRISLGLLLDPGYAFLAAYQLHYTLDILCCSDSPLPSTADLSRN